MFIPNPNFALEKQREYIDGLKAIGQDVRERAYYVKNDVMPNKDRSGVEVVESGGKVYVANTDHGGHIDEFGSVNSQPYAPLRTAARAAGLRLEESSE